MVKDRQPRSPARFTNPPSTTRIGLESTRLLAPLRSVPETDVSATPSGPRALRSGSAEMKLVLCLLLAVQQPASFRGERVAVQSSLGRCARQLVHPVLRTRRLIPPLGVSVKDEIDIPGRSRLAESKNL